MIYRLKRLKLYPGMVCDGCRNCYECLRDDDGVTDMYLFDRQTSNPGKGKEYSNFKILGEAGNCDFRMSWVVPVTSEKEIKRYRLNMV